MTDRKPPAPPAKTGRVTNDAQTSRHTTIAPRPPYQGGYQPTSEGKPGGPPNKPPGGGSPKR